MLLQVKVVHPDWVRLSCHEGIRLPEDKFLIVKEEVISILLGLGLLVLHSYPCVVTRVQGQLIPS